MLKNSLKLSNMIYKKINYATFINGLNTEIDENLLPIKYSINTFNFSFKNGALKDGLGIEKVGISYNSEDREQKKLLELPENLDVLGVWVFNRFTKDDNKYNNYLMLYCSDGKLYANFLRSSTTKFVPVSSLVLSSCPTILNYKLNGQDVIIIVNKEDGMYVWNSIDPPEHIENAPIINSMCLHYERLFVTTDGDKRTVWFSDDLDPTNWNVQLNEAGFIEINDERGVLNRVVSFNDYVYVFREFGISRITAFAEQSNFFVTQLYTSGGRIYPDSICICGDRILFLASDGLFVFNGSTATKISLNIDKLFENTYNDKSKAAYFNGCYYLACRLNFNDGNIVGCEDKDYDNNALIELDVKTGEYTIMRGVDIQSLTVIKELSEHTILVCYKDSGIVKLGQISKSGKVEDISTKKVWQSPKTDFGLPLKDKVLREVILTSESDCEIVVHCDNDSCSFKVKGNKNPQIVKVLKKGRYFSLDFISNSIDTNISNPQVVIGYSYD